MTRPSPQDSRRARSFPVLRAIAIAAGIVFAMLTVVVALHHGPLPGDRTLAERIQACSCTWMTPFTDVVVFLGGAVEFIAALVVLAVVALFWRRAFLFALVSLGYSAIYAVVALAVGRPRPTGLPHPTPHLGFAGFPSGHVGFFIWVSLLVILFVRERGDRAAWAVAAVAAVFIAIVSVSRVYVSAHWPSDVAGGLLLSLSWLSLTLSFPRLTRNLRRSAGRP